MVEADIKEFFNHVCHGHLMRFLEHRLTDPRLLEVLRRFLKAGVLEDGVFTVTEEGTPQGGLVSPVLSNIYLHYVLDWWFEGAFAKTCHGTAKLVRYADDFAAFFRDERDARRFLAEMQDRLRKFALEVEPSKTQLLRFGSGAWMESKRGDGKRPAICHCLPQLPFDQGMHQECDVIEERQRLDARHVLQPNRGKILNCFELLKSFFQLWLRFVCSENLTRLEIPAIRDEREHPIASGVGLDEIVINQDADAELLARDFPIFSVRPRTSLVRLPKLRLLQALDLNVHPSSRTRRVQDPFDFLVDSFPGPDAATLAFQPGLELFHCNPGLFDPSLTGIRIFGGHQGVPHPDDAIALLGWQLGLGHLPDIRAT